MYKFHLIFKYLRKRRIAWVALVAVALCTMMVLVVMSVMGGWINTFRNSARGMTGDIVVRGESITGFPFYQEMIEEFRKLPEVKQAAPSINSFVLLYIPNTKIRRPAQIVGFPPEITQTNEWTSSLFRRKDTRGDPFALWPNRPYSLYAGKPQAANWPGMIVGTGVCLRKNEDGTIDRPELLYQSSVHVTALPISPHLSSIDVQERAEADFWIVDDSRTQMFQYDSDTVYVPFDALQKLLNMDAREVTVIRDGQEQKDIEHARTNNIHVALKPGANIAAAKPKIEEIAVRIAGNHGMDARFSFRVETWQERNARFLGIVEKEKMIITILNGIMSIVAVFLVFCIFYMIVMEKTKDIGIIKSVGASNAGVAAIFLWYGAVIGIVGSAIGLLLGYLIVHNINELHAWLGKAFGVSVWDPEFYVFDTIPNRLDPFECAIILGVAVLSSILGSLLPALRAAWMHPVEALRWE